MVCPGCGRHGDPVCAACAGRLHPAPPASPPVGVDAWWAAFAYEGVAREVVARVKYRGARAAIPWLADAVVDVLRSRPPRGRRRHLGTHQPRAATPARLRSGRAARTGGRTPVAGAVRRAARARAGPAADRARRRRASARPELLGPSCDPSVGPGRRRRRHHRRDALGRVHCAAPRRRARHRRCHRSQNTTAADPIGPVVDSVLQPRTQQEQSAEEVRWTSRSVARTGRCRPVSTRRRARRCPASRSSPTTPGASRSTSPSSSTDAWPSRSCARSRSI